ncbi:hypothetical protein [Actinomadura oligospora]|uniref:hypothetical protein n=1 Tax=Actinomadura oligospora TaxID=111804 RepID=UPI0004B8DC1B|nr:hypothetical protein [Actinomadura oligospora]
MTTSDDPAASPAVRRSELDSVTSSQDLAKLLVEQYARADASLRELELRANRAGGTRLARATCADMLAGRRIPKKAVMLAFLRACHVPEDQLPDWERAWERAKIAQLSTAPASTPERDEPLSERSPGGPEDDDAPAGQETEQAVVAPPGRRRGFAWRRTGVWAGLAAAAGLLTALGLFALIGTGPPPPRLVTDDGRAFTWGGSSRFTVTIDAANTGVRLIRRLDAGVAMQTATVAVDGALAAVWQPLHEGPHGWRDQTVLLPHTLTLGRRSLTITNTFVSSELDFNEFSYFVEQRVDGGWSHADTVDVGPNHLDSEAAHHYRITHQSWSGTHLFGYLK